MMMVRLLFSTTCMSLLLALPSLLFGQTMPSKPAQQLLDAAKAAKYNPKIDSADQKRIVGFLAADQLAGRMTGSQGADMAALYLAARMEAMGLKPAGRDGSYFFGFGFPKAVKVNEDLCQLSVKGRVLGNYKLDKDFKPLHYSSNADAQGGLVWVGYGLQAAEIPGQAAYNSFEGLDLKGKWALLVDGFPDELPMNRRMHLSRYADLSTKIVKLKQLGALGALVLPARGQELAQMSTGSADLGLPVLALSRFMAIQLMEAAGLPDSTLKRLPYQSSAPAAKAMDGIELQATVFLVREKGFDKDVLGLLPATSTTSPTETLIVGAHYDHIGLGEHNSLAAAEDRQHVHNGADDNASGVAAVLELAHALSQQPQRSRAVIFALWSGEELGLLGSQAYAATRDSHSTLAYLNFDMVGSYRQELSVQGLGSSAGWAKLLDSLNPKTPLKIAYQSDPYQPTDVTSFYPRGIPVLSFFTGITPHYHRPSDDVDKINFTGLYHTTAFAQQLILALMNVPKAQLAWQAAAAPSGGRSRYAVTLGIMPDYTAEGIQGLKLTGVRAGSPAEAAGIQAGDIIVMLAGQSIGNVQEYMAVLGALKPGEKVPVAVLRSGSRVELQVVPQGRQ